MVSNFMPLKANETFIEFGVRYLDPEVPIRRTVGLELNAMRQEVSFHTAPQEELRCADGIDNDLDANIDCLDEDCDGRECKTPQGAPGKCINFLCVPFEFECADGIDNDLDGLIDCEDPDCDRELCSHINDSRYCYLGLCQGPPHESGCYPWEPTEHCPWRCGNGVDDDGNGPADCKDPDCDGLRCFRQGSACIDEMCTETKCDDKVDNDNDQLVDCEDPDCDGQPCGDGATCSLESTSCLETLCWDGIDNDGNELIDCDDPSCDGQPCADGAICVDKRCAEWTCTDGHDNDGDFRIDCDDPDCERRPCGDGGAECIGGRCVEQECWDGRDNDGGGLTDCADPDCDGRLCEVKGLFGVCWERQCIPCEDCADHRCVDAPCGHGMKCKKGCEPAEDNCANGIDDDNDNLIDCLDDDCDGSACLTSAGTWGTCIQRVCM